MARSNQTLNLFVWSIVALALNWIVLPSAARSALITFDGTVRYRDFDDTIRPVRGVTVEVYDVNDFALDSLIMSGTSNPTDGSFSFTFDDAEHSILDAGTADVSFRFYTDGTNFRVFDPDVILGEDRYFFDTHPSNNSVGGTITVTMLNNDDTGKAFAVNDAVFQISQFAQQARGAIPATQVDVKFPAAPNVAFYDDDDNEINIGSNLWPAWDVIQHEYGHFLAEEEVDDLDSSPGGAHCFGVSNITGSLTCPDGTADGTLPGRGKVLGTRLGWGEGLANYIGIAAQHVTSATFPNVAGTGGTLFDNYTVAAADRFNASLESPFGSSNDGEGDETSVMRILWDIGDPGNELHDQIDVGHVDLYNILRKPEVTGPFRLDNLWDHLFDNTDDLELGVGVAVDEARAILGDIFQEI